MKIGYSKGRITNLFFRFVNVVKDGITRTMVDRSLDLVRDGAQNDYPQYLTQIIYASPTATACMGRLTDFIKGKGVADSLKDVIVNKEMESFADIHEKIAIDFAFFRRFAIRILPKRGGEIAEVYHIPAEYVRWGYPDDDTNEVNHVVVNPWFGTSEERRKDHNRIYPLWENDATRVRETVREFGDEYRGHVLFFNLTSPVNRNYSRPDYFSAEDYILTDAKVGEFHNRNTDNNFFLGGILSVFGDPDQALEDEDGTKYSTVGDEFSKQLAESFSGANNAGNILVDWYQSEEERSSFQPYQASQNHEMFTTLHGIIESVISIAFGIPKILLGVPTAGKLGESQEVRNAIKYVNERTNRFRMKLEATYRKVFENFAGWDLPEDEKVIDVIQDYTDLPDSVFNALSFAQKQTYLHENFNIEPEEREEKPAEPAVEIQELMFTENRIENGRNNEVHR